MMKRIRGGEYLRIRGAELSQRKRVRVRGVQSIVETPLQLNGLILCESLTRNALFIKCTCFSYGANEAESNSHASSHEATISCQCWMGRVQHTTVNGDVEIYQSEVGIRTFRHPSRLSFRSPISCIVGGIHR
jgi:hypothetical protein